MPPPRSNSRFKAKRLLPNYYTRRSSPFAKGNMDGHDSPERRSADVAPQTSSTNNLDESFTDGATLAQPDQPRFGSPLDESTLSAVLQSDVRVARSSKITHLLTNA